MTNTQKTTLKIATVLWVIWGLVHAFAGGVVLSSDASSGFAAIADAVDPAALAAEYHPAAGGILNQHGWNLLWFGVATIIGGVLIWRGNMTAIWVTGMVGGLADLGYLLATSWRIISDSQPTLKYGLKKNLPCSTICICAHFTLRNLIHITD